MSINYYEKYLLYKNKYLKLKEEYINSDNDDIQTGGNSFFYILNGNLDKEKPKRAFKNCYIKLSFQDDTILKNYINQDKIYYLRNLPGLELPYDFHMTLLQFEINCSHPLNTYNFETNIIRKIEDINNNFVYVVKDNNKRITDKIFSQKFIDFLASINLTRKFKEIFMNTTFDNSIHELIGQDPNVQYLVQKLQYTDYNIPALITQFRTYFYTKLKEYIKNLCSLPISVTISEDTENVGGFYTKKYRLPREILDLKKYENFKISTFPYDDPLIAIPDYYYGIGVWEPHISLLKFQADKYIPTNDHIENLQENNTYQGLKFKLDDSNIAHVICE
jgi:hypothetical protein